MKSTPVFNSGIPTAPDVEALMKAFGVPAEGKLIPYEKVEEAIHSPMKSNRWHSVVIAWRKKLWREHNVELGTDPGKGFVALAPNERVDVNGRGYKSGLRKIVRCATRATVIPGERLNPDELRARDHIVRAGAAIRLAAATTAKELRYTNGEK